MKLYYFALIITVAQCFSLDDNVADFFHNLLILWSSKIVHLTTNFLHFFRFLFTFQSFN